MNFETLGLIPELIDALAAEGYEDPTPIQRETIPIALAGRDVVGSAQTGTGKTAAFMLPTLQRLRQHEAGGIRTLVLGPTRELAEQVLERTLAYGQFLDLKAAAIYGGVSYEPQLRALKRGVDIIVATPGRLLDHVERGNIRFDRVEILILDEADRMLDMGFAPDVFRILDALPTERQTLLFSATISGDVDRLARRAMAGHASVEIGDRATPAEGIEHGIIAVDRVKKQPALAALLRVRPKGRALVFTRTKWQADVLASFLDGDGLAAAPMHGDLPQSMRQRTLEAFREGKIEVLVASDVAARGIDVDDISIVVNYDVPDDAEVYVHRVGRTARAGAKGLALTLVAPDEWLLVADIERLIQHAIPRDVLPGFEPSMDPLPSVLDKRPAPRAQRSVRMRRGGRSR